jgi:hypothetical protein
VGIHALPLKKISNGFDTTDIYIKRIKEHISKTKPMMKSEVASFLNLSDARTGEILQLAREEGSIIKIRKGHLIYWGIPEEESVNP